MWKEVIPLALLSLKISSSAVILASIIGVPLGIFLYLKNLPGKRIIIIILNTFMGVPTVTVGLVVYLILSRQGPLGFLGWLFTPWAMIVAQTLLALPLITALSQPALQAISRELRETAITLGANFWHLGRVMISEARYGILSAIITGFGRVIGEVGAAMMVGGNIKGSTRIMTTAIALEINRGEYQLAILLGIILVGIAFLVNIVLNLLQHWGR